MVIKKAGLTSQTQKFNEMNRKLYRKPQLKDLGDLRTLTLGGSWGSGESSPGRRVSYDEDIIQPGDFPIFNPDGTLRDPNDPLNTP